MLEMDNGPVPVFVRVTVFGALVVPTFTFPKLRLVGERLTAGAVPVPVRLTVCGLPLALSVTVKLAAHVPEAVGVNVTLKVQLELAASVEGLSGQLFVWPKSPAFVPPRAMPLMVNGAVPVFESVTVCGALVVLTG